jgi:hypothetical protein
MVYKHTFAFKKEKLMEILETQFVQRSFDGRWEKIVRIMDKENAYTYKNETGTSVTLIPEKWVTIAVYDFMMEIQ